MLADKQCTTLSAQLLCLFKEYDELEKNPSGQTGGLLIPLVMEFQNNVSKLQIGKFLLSKLSKYSLLESPHFASEFSSRLFA